ncbi:CDP-alcohol phosphatidyltransferase family protein [Shimia abyssi]|uniref:CDP-alcohol phosphatidyltransferase-like enzyme n=1 Tax=Shimia abyssi TaxID=1662395 RepID=A0A2P8FAI6_9RHOB|nr:CDP-alcohol phosphatidyltransferase family protein [Shimia abyssi]PSL18735.1 hypothetical protein CLV88_109120 [Shimia abyssi]
MQYTFKQVASANRATAQAEKGTNWSVYLLYRGLGTVLAWLLLKTSTTPTRVTVVALGVVTLIPVMAGFLPLWLAGSVCFVLAFLFQVLDCADGSMARACGTDSAAGARYDFLVDMFQWGVLYASIGLLADRLGDGGTFWTMIGFAAGWLRLFARVCNDSVPEGESDDDGPKMWGIMWFLNGLSGLVPLLFLSGPYMYLAVIAVLVYSIGDILDALTRVIE